MTAARGSARKRVPSPVKCITPADCSGTAPRRIVELDGTALDRSAALVPSLVAKSAAMAVAVSVTRENHLMTASSALSWSCRVSPAGMLAPNGTLRYGEPMRRGSAPRRETVRTGGREHCPHDVAVRTQPSDRYGDRLRSLRRAHSQTDRRRLRARDRRPGDEPVLRRLPLWPEHGLRRQERGAELDWQGTPVHERDVLVRVQLVRDAHRPASRPGGRVARGGKRR